MHKTLRRLPSLDFLRGFEASGRLLSFTRAAAELHLTQSALSRQVAAIEEALGVALFERAHRALKLTPEGIVVTEIAPGVELQANILDQAEFPLIVSPALKQMEAGLLRPDVMGMKLDA